jgi:hypothetical protein
MMMKRSLLLLPMIALLLVALPATAATLTGRIVNGTTGESARADRVALFDVTRADGDPVAEALDVDGEFTLDGIPEAAAAHFRLQVWIGDADFTQHVTSFDEPMEVFVYDSTDEITDVFILRHHIIFTRDPEHMQVTEFFEFDNRTDPPRVIVASALPMRLELDHDIHGEASASLMGTSTPVQVDLVSTDDATVVGLSTELPPGPTRAVVRYLMHEEDRALTWATHSLFDTEERQIFINPTDIAADAGDMIPTDSIIDEYAAYTGLSSAPGDEWVVNLSGGSAGVSATDHSSHDETSRAAEFTEIVSRPNRLTNSRTKILLGLGAVLLLATVTALTTTRRSVAAKAGNSGEARLAVSKIADRYVSGDITREEYEREAARHMKKSGHRAPAAPVH